MSLHRRLERLETLSGGRAEPAQAKLSRAMERWLHAHENARRVIEGREPLPDLPYTDEDRENDRAFLQEGIPAYRAGPGWQTEEARAVLDYWEQSLRERLGEEGGAEAMSRER